MSLDIVPTTLQSTDLERIFRERKIPLDRFCLVDKSGTLYVAKGAGISRLLDPITYERVKVVHGFQTFVGSIELAGSLFHDVFLDEGDVIVNGNGSALILEPVSLSAWTEAILSVTFQVIVTGDGLR